MASLARRSTEPSHGTSVVAGQDVDDMVMAASRVEHASIVTHSSFKFQFSRKKKRYQFQFIEKEKEKTY